MAEALSDHNCNKSLKYSDFFQIGKGRGERVLILGESLAENGWRKSGRAFYTPEGRLLPTGKRLNLLLEKIGLQLEECSFTEIAKCFIGKERKLLYECGRKCWPLLIEQLEHFKCKLIITLGLTTLDIINIQTGEALVPGKLSKIKLNERQYYILPIYHPSPINPHNQRRNEIIFEQNIGKLKNIINS